MLEITTITDGHSHVGSQALGEVRRRLVDVFLCQLFPALHDHFSVVIGFRIFQLNAHVFRFFNVNAALSSNSAFACLHCLVTFDVQVVLNKRLLTYLLT